MSDLKSTKKKLATPEKGYEKRDDELWVLPYNSLGMAVRQGDIVAETDNGYLYVPTKDHLWSSISYMPKKKVQL